MTAAFADSLGMAVPYGAIFARPQPGSPAAKAGIEAGDVVMAVNGVPLEHLRDFAKLISMMAPGSSVYLDTMRDGQAINVRLTVHSNKCQSLAAAENSRRANLSHRANSAKVAAAQHKRKRYVTCGWVGVRVMPMTAAFTDSLGRPVPYGAIFATPQLGSPAAKAGIEAGDIVTAVDGKHVEHSRDFTELISMKSPGSSVYLNTMRNGAARFVRLTVGSIKCQFYCSKKSICLPGPVS